MKIVRHGTVTLRQEGGPLVEDWLVERELTVPPDATAEELLLDCVITWAHAKFLEASNGAVLGAYRKRILAARATAADEKNLN